MSRGIRASSFDESAFMLFPRAPHFSPTSPSLALLLAAGTLAHQPATTPPPSPPPSPTAAPTAPAITTADDLLSALETADKGIRTLSAQVAFAKILSEIEGGEVHLRTGRLYFAIRPAGEDDRPKDAKRDAPGSLTPPAPASPEAKPAPASPLRVFAAVFETLQVDKTLRNEKRQFIFDGSSVVERNFDAKQYSRRRVVAPGSRTDPLRLGEGPFPIPIGQRKADILARFDASLVPPLEGIEETDPNRAIMAETYQLKLTPKPGTPESRTFAEVRLWYRTSDKLPRRARTLSPQGGQSDVTLIGPEVNKPIDDAVFDMSAPTTPDWTADIRDEVRGEAPTPSPATPTTPPAPKPPDERPKNPAKR